MPEQYAGAGELDHAEKVLDVIFPSGDRATGVMEPGEEALDLPPASPAAERAPILGRGASAAAPMRRDHLDAIPLAQKGIEGVAVVAAVAD
jgi:hypothetical protein